MLTMERKRTRLFEDIADYAKDGRLTEPSDEKRYEWRRMIEAVMALGRPLTDEEAEQYQRKERILFEGADKWNLAKEKSDKSGI